MFKGDQMAPNGQGEEETVDPIPGRRSWWDIIKKIILIPGLATFAIVVIFSFIQFPRVSIEFLQYSGPMGYGSFYQLIIEIKEGRPSGINDLRVSLNLPTDIIKFDRLTDGGCKDIGDQLDPIIQKIGFENKTIKRSASVFAEKCSDGAKIIYRIETALSQYGDPLVNDEGSYECHFNWELLLEIINLPITKIPGLKKTGKIMPKVYSTPYIPTYGYPASISLPPYFDHSSKTGNIMSILYPRDFNERLDKDQTYVGISRPSTKVKLFSKRGGVIEGNIHWIHCEEKIVVREIVEQLPIDRIKWYENNKLHVGIQLQWDACGGSIRILPVKMPSYKNFQ